MHTSRLAKGAYVVRGLNNIMIPHIRPTIPKIILLYSRNIRKTVMIGIMSHRFIFIMS